LKISWGGVVEKVIGGVVPMWFFGYKRVLKNWINCDKTMSAILLKIEMEFV
jgi:hypothetical protein